MEVQFIHAVAVRVIVDQPTQFGQCLQLRARDAAIQPWPVPLAEIVTEGCGDCPGSMAPPM